jgi:hypothetical protein
LRADGSAARTLARDGARDALVSPDAAVGVS